MTVSRLLSLVCASVMVVVAGCHSPSTSTSSRASGSAPAPLVDAGCPPVGAGWGTGTGLPANDMPKNDMPKNGLTEAALRANGDLLDHLRDAALARTAIQGPWLEQIQQSWTAGPLVAYIVACALSPGMTVDLPRRGDRQLGTPVYDALTRKYPGGLPGRYEFCPEWRDNAVPANSDCLKKVTSCVMAHVNAMGSTVTFSMRTPTWKPVTHVPVSTEFRENHGTRIDSFKSCGRICLRGHELHRNCDWQPRHVGKCTTDRRRKAMLRLTSGTTQSVRVRICAGLAGCDYYPESSPTPVLDAGDTTLPHERLPPYEGHIVASATLHPTPAGGAATDTIEFPCSGDAASGSPGRFGYYSVMVAPVDYGGSLPATVDLEAVTAPSQAPNAYPATEDQVFTFHEGAFFGSMFEPASTADVIGQPGPGSGSGRPRKQEPEHSTSVAPNFWVCHGDKWNDDKAMYAHRVCAGETPLEPYGCFSHRPTKCWIASNDETCTRVPLTTTVGGVVTTTYIAGACKGAGPNRDFTSPVTTYLSDPCEMHLDPRNCRADAKQGNDLPILPQNWTSAL